MRKGEITAELVSCLVSEQFPQWADLEIRRVEFDGSDNTTFRLGRQMSVRIPSHDKYVPQIDKERRWLPVFAANVPVPIPRPIAKGEPGCGFPRPWSIYGWLDGEPIPIVGVTDHDRLATDLGRFLWALEEVDTMGGPAPGPHSFNRGGPLSVWDNQARATIDELASEIDASGALEVWEAAAAERWTGPDVWVHGDVTGSNLLLRGDRLCGVIDFGCAAVGDPACDLTAAWTLFEGTSRQRFMASLNFDQNTWARARGWALWKALIVIPRRPLDDPGRTGVRFGWRWDALGVVDQVITDFRYAG
ncbi:MAG TPA: aminoglycoside phosphotransferase family protein [Acidimicrobiales bacterium]|nr:aminoglycoside phosphotransferase family protein [Acidimicrobiales bacterium]